MSANGGVYGLAAALLLAAVRAALMKTPATSVSSTFVATAAILTGLGVAGMLLRGIPRMGNDAVNLVSNVLVAGLTLWILT